MTNLSEDDKNSGTFSPRPYHVTSPVLWMFRTNCHWVSLAPTRQLHTTFHSHTQH